MRYDTSHIDTPEAVIKAFRSAFLTKDYDYIDWLYNEVAKIVQDPESSPKNISTIADLFLEDTERTTYDNFGDMFWLADTSMTTLLKSPTCPVSVLTKACRCRNLYYAYVAGQHPSCPEEDSVYVALAMTVPGWFDDGKVSGYWGKSDYSS